MGNQICAVLVMVAIAVTSAACKRKTKSDGAGSAATTPAASSAPAKPDVAKATDVVDVTAGKLYQEYISNEIGADSKFRDRVLRVKGIVARIGRDALDQPYLAFVVAGGSESLKALFAAETGLADVKRNDVATIRCAGGSEYHKPTLTACIFESVEK